MAGRASDFSVHSETHEARECTKHHQNPEKAADFVQNFRASRLRIGSAQLPRSPKTAENRRLSAVFWGYSSEIRADFAPVQGVVLAVFWPVETNSVSIAGWQADALTGQ
jgi:hypothetical protein